MKWLALCGMLVLICVTSANVVREEEVARRIKRQIPDDGTCSMADLVFVLDSSGSLKIENWKKVLRFVAGIVDKLSIGPLDSRIGVVYYGSSATLGFHLNRYQRKEDVIKAVLELPWKDEETNTSGGIWYMRQNMFNADRGDRIGAPNIGVVITDGESNRDKDKTIPYANEAKLAGITMIAIGVGASAQKKELEGIATNSSYVFSADDFKALKAIEAKIIDAACDVPVTCSANPDVVFVLDASGSVREKNFLKMKDFVKSVVDTVNVDTDYSSNVGLMAFADNAHIVFHLDKYNTRYDIKQAVSSTRYWRGTTNTAEALRKLRTEMFVQSKGDRPSRPNIAILFTDGGSNDFDRTLKEAMLARQAGITIIVVAVSDWVNQNEVKEVATDPDEHNVFHVVNFNQISTIKNQIAEILCNGIAECLSNPCANGGTCKEGINKYKCICPKGFAGVRCQYKCDAADVVLALDTSGSFGKRNFYKVLDFTKDIISNLNIDGQSRSRVGLETFSDQVSVKFHLNTYSKDEDIRSAISYPYKGGRTNTALALQTMRESMFTSTHGDRPTYRNVGIVLTDGESNDRAKTFQEAVANRNKNIEMISIGIGIKSVLGQREIRGIANDPDDKNVINVNSFDGLSSVIPSLIQSVCNSVNECESNPCQGGGTCVDVMNGYTCKCSNGRTGVHCERQCDGKADIVIAIDASGSIRESRFTKVLDYVKAVVNSLEVAEDRARVGVIVFSDQATIKFHMNTFRTKQDVLQAIEMIVYTRGRTNIADTLKKLRTDMFTAAHGDRDDVPNYAILITDGESTVNREKTLPEAVETRIAGVILTVVVVGYRTASLEVKGIASDPDDRHVMAVENYDGLKKFIEKTIGNTCDAVNECERNPCANGGRCINMHGQFYCKCRNEYTGLTCERRCRARSDVIFVLDASGSVETSYAMAQEMTRRIVNGLNFDGGRTRVGVVTYSDSAKARFYLNSYTDKTSVLNAISYTLENGRTNTASGIDMARYNMFSSNKGDRAGDQNYAVIITDGNSNINRGGTIPAANGARRAGIKMIAIGIGENRKVDRSEINGIANDPDNQFAFMLDNKNQLDEIANKVLNQICQ